MPVRSIALLLAWGAAECVQAHPHCWTDERAVDLDDQLEFCSSNDDAEAGVCCTDAEEEAVLAKFEAAGSLTADCGDLYKQVECAICGSYSGHLYERLDGTLTLTNSFCESLTSACEGQLDFEDDYCDTATGGGDDLFWSYPYEGGDIFEPGFTEVFPDLPDEDKPGYTLAMHQSPDGGMYWLAGKEGMLKQVDDVSSSSSSTVMDISGGIFYDGSTEEGLLDFAFSPMFETNGYFYVSYTIDDGVIRNRLSRFVYYAGDSTATRDSETVLIDSEERQEYLHNGGWVGFKPSDYGTNADSHDLYWSVGDAGPQEDPYDHAQRTDILFGSMVRISVPSDGTGYDIPSGNYPGGLPEICAIGFRGHWRCGFDKETDELYCGDVGYNYVESIYTVECGNNYGWVRFEGTRCTEFSEDAYGPCSDADRGFMTPPIFEYCHYDYDSSIDSEAVYTGDNDLCGDRTVEGNTVIGGHVYRGQAYVDLLYGAYIFAEYTGGNIYYIQQGSDGSWSAGTIISDSSVAVVSFTEDIDGELMIIDAFNGVYYLPCGDVCLADGSSPTPDPPTPQPSTPELSTPQPSTPELSTPQPSTPEQPTPQPTSVSGSTPAPVEAAYTYLGCFVDSSDRTLPEIALMGSGEMTTELCAEACAGWTYFGTEYGSECFCGDSGDTPEDLDSAVCDSQCAGQSDELCGGYWSISVYEFTGDTAGVAVAAEDSQDDSSATSHSPSSAFVGLRASLAFSISAVFMVSWLV